jgi:D-3-phosphoglycerate dehydrogenase
MSAIVIIDQMHPSIIPQLESLEYHIDYQPEINRQQLERIIGKYQGLIVRSKTVIDRDLLEKTTKLQFVARAGAGVDNLEEDAIRQRGIHIINAPEGNRDTLGEHVVGMLLNMLHRISEASNSVRMGHWDREGFRGTELAGKTVGIIGCGNMGNAFGKRLQNFDCTVLGYDKYLPEKESTIYQRVSINKLYDKCDIVSLHVPLSPETKGYYNYSFFQQFEKPIILLNSARGEILPLKDLVQLIKEDKILAAGLDVFEKEPYVQLSHNQSDIYNYLISSPLVLLSPHVAGWSIESYKRINNVLVDKIKRLQAAGLID